MRYSTFEGLPLEALYQLLADAVTKLLVAYDSNLDELKEFHVHKRQVEGILTLIEGIKKETAKGQ